MKKVLLLLPIACISMQAFASSWLPDLDQARMSAFLQVVESRCFAYAPARRDGGAAAAACAAANSAMQSVLDVAYMPKASGFATPVIFSNELLQVLNESQTTQCIQAINSDLKYAKQGMMDFDLWKTLIACSGNELAAARFAATLWQDVSHNGVHFKWLKLQKLNTLQANNLKLLLKLMDKIQNIQMLGFPKLTMIHGRDDVYKGSIYHYYVPLYLSLRMVEEGAGRCATLANVFFFNYIYEVEEQYGKSVVLFEPSSIDHQYTLHDIELGLSGAIDGSGVRLGVDKKFRDRLGEWPMNEIANLIRSCK